MHVCRQWRVAATHTRSIWSKIMLATSNIANERRQDGYEFCHSVALLRNALARAGEGPIDLYCKFGRFSCSIPQRDYWATPQQMVDVLRETGAHHRIRFLEMRKPSSETIEEVEKIDLSGFQLLTLKETILNWSFQGLNECIQKTAPQLRRLYIPRTYDNAQYDWDLSKLISLSDLELAKKADSGLEAVRMISSAPNLVKLSLTSVAIEPPTGEPVSVPTLRELRLQYTRIKCKVMFPGLRILSIDKSTLLTSASQPLILPSLALLELVELKADECPHIHARSLQKLEMCSFTRSVRILERLFELTILPGHLRTRSIRLHSAYVDSEALADVLDQMPGLVEIHLGNKFPVDKPFFEELAGYSLHSSSISDPREPICTSLETIKLDTSWIPRLATKLAMIKWLRKAVDARAKGPFPLKEALLKEEYNEPWVSLL
ncbi:hypothetical protein FRC15_000696 [Serendipita sp. 397]|nr:hypothetical protein FRC15_000696 [Serendipita sp. 397]